jgi:FtsH-binding integral membrane protein
MKKYLNYLGITGVYTSGLGLVTHSVIPKLKNLLALHHTPYTTAFIAVFVVSVGFLYLRKKRHRRQATQLVFKYLGVSGIASSGILLTLQELLKIGQ